MKLFIDSAKREEIQQAYAWGIIDGVTTNPSLLKKAVDALVKKGEKISLETYIKKILKTAKGTPVSLEVTTATYKEMVAEGKELFKTFNPTAKNVYIKIPVNPCMEKVCSRDMDGIKAIRTLSREHIPINCTLIFTPEQSLLAAKAGATFVSPFLGRENDFIREKAHIKFEKTEYFPAHGITKRRKMIEDEGIISGIDLIAQTAALFRAQKINAKILAASIRNQRELREAALAGADIATMPFALFTKIAQHQKTQEGMRKFTHDVVPAYAKIAGGKK